MGKEKVDDALSFFCMLELLKELKKKEIAIYFFIQQIPVSFLAVPGFFLKAGGLRKVPGILFDPH